MKPIIVLQHSEGGPPGTIGHVLTDSARPWEVRRLWLGEPLPAEPSEAAGMVLMGGFMSVRDDAENPFFPPEKALLQHALQQDLPILGVCLGCQLLAEAGGGGVYSREIPELGWFHIEQASLDPIFADIPAEFTAFEWHNDSVTPPPDAEVLAERPDGVQAFRRGRAWGVQFHIDAELGTVLSWSTHLERPGESFDPTLAARMRKQAHAFMPAYVRLSGRLVGNWLSQVPEE